MNLFKSIFTLLALTSISLSSQPSDAFVGGLNPNKMFSKELKKEFKKPSDTPAPRPEPPNPAPICADFSGSWKGSCTTTSKYGTATNSSLIQWTQTNCTRFAITNFEVDGSSSSLSAEVGAVVGINLANSNFSADGRYRFLWHSDRSKLFILENVSSQGMSSEYASSASGKWQIKFNGSQVVADGNFQSAYVSPDSQASDTMTISCVYDRVQN